jgi:PAS domain S-box-containing protein
MKILYLAAYFIINVAFVALVFLLKLPIIVNILFVSIFNILIIFFSQKQAIAEITFLSQKILLSNSDDIKENLDGYLSDVKIMSKNFEDIKVQMRTSSESNQKPLAVSLETILNSTIDGIIVVNLNREIIMANDSFFRLCGYKTFEISGKDNTKMVSPENILSRSLIRFIKFSFEKAEKDLNAVSTGTIEIVNSKPEKMLIATATPLKYSPNKLEGLVINLRDTTKELEDFAERADFITGLCLELTKPLDSTLKYLHKITNENLDQEITYTLIKNAYQQTLQLSDITENLLNALHLAKDEHSVKLEKIDFHNLIDKTVSSSEQKLKASRLECIYSFNSSVNEIINDKNNLFIIILNLLSNAIKHSPKGGRVLIETEKKDTNIVISFVNYGPPIELKYLGSLFDKFSKTDDHSSSLPGAGLGLYLSRKLAREHGGDIKVKTSESQTVFDLILPVQSKFEKGKFNTSKKNKTQELKQTW